MTTLNFRPFGNSFQDVAYQAIARTERRFDWKDLIPRDIGDGHVTIGAGLNLTGGHRSVRYAAYRQLGIRVELDGTINNDVGKVAQRAAERNYISRLDAALATPGWTVDRRVAELHAIMAARSANSLLNGYADNRPAVFGFSTGDVGEQQIRRSFDEASIAYDADLIATLTTYESSIPARPNFTNSWEHAALLSMTWNGGTGLIGARLKSALSNGDRSEAWFEIRYNSNNGSSRGRGLAKRRYYEAALFSLYDNSNAYADPTLVGTEEAKGVYRMYQLNRSAIDNYERQYGGQAGIANVEFKLVGTAAEARGLINSLIPAQTALFDWLRQENPTLTDLYPENYLATNIYLDPGRDASIDPDTRQPIAFDSNHKGYLYALKFDSQNTEIASNDILIGEAGDDWLLGGKGDDVLLGGTGDDIYYYRTGDGDDRIIDADKKARLLINGSGIELLVKDGDAWKSPDGKVTLAQTDGRWKLAIEGGGSLDLGTSFTDGDYGIRRLDLPPTIEPTIKGDLDPIDADLGTDGIQYGYDALGNVKVSATANPDRPDRLFGSDGNDRLQGLGGDDELAARAGADILEGGSGSDLLAGEVGSDALYGDAQTALSAAWTQNEAGIGLNARGDWLDGGDDDDLLVGSQARDILSGGLGADLLLGGAGDDLLAGDMQRTSARSNWNVGFDTTTNLYTIFNADATVSETAGSADALYGGAGDDWLLGLAGDDLLEGGSGKDMLDGGAGNDLIDGGAYGDDLLIGGAGADSYVFGWESVSNWNENGIDTIIEAAGELSSSPPAKSRRWRHGELSANDSAWRIVA